MYSHILRLLYSVHHQCRAVPPASCTSPLYTYTHTHHAVWLFLISTTLLETNVSAVYPYNIVCQRYYARYILCQKSHGQTPVPLYLLLLCEANLLPSLEYIVFIFSETEKLVSPPDVLDRLKCLNALAALRHAKWFQVRHYLNCTMYYVLISVIQILKPL